MQSLLTSKMINKKFKTIPASSEPKHIDVSPPHLGLVHDILPIGCYASTLALSLAEDHPNFSNLLLLLAIDLEGMSFLGKLLLDVSSGVLLVEVLHTKKHGQHIKKETSRQLIKKVFLDASLPFFPS